MKELFFLYNKKLIFIILRNCIKKYGLVFIDVIVGVFLGGGIGVVEGIVCVYIGGVIFIWNV